MERKLMSQLAAWKNAPGRKPLILCGVRQCGKTWLLQEFGKRYFDNTAYFNFERNERLRSVFEKDISPSRILMELALLAKTKIEPGSTLIIFDEIQSSPRALNSLKYFCEEKPEYVISAAGSLLGVALSAQSGFPVGKVNFLELYPCSFDEYLAAADPQLSEYAGSIGEARELSPAVADEFEKHLRIYLVLGGMPEVLNTFIAAGDIAAAERVQDEILKAYELDFSKHAPVSDIVKLFLLWKSIPLQLARENAKFIYGEVRSGTRARDLEDALRRLQEAGLVNRINRIEKPNIPLAAYEDHRSFKLYLTDTGLLRRLADIPAESVIMDQDIFSEYRGRLAENFVQQQLTALGKKSLFYWTSGNTAKVDFVMQERTHIIPVEVKSGMNIRSRSLKVYREKYHPQIALRFSMQNLHEDDGLINIPLYLLSRYTVFLPGTCRP
ncbi:MAG: ATP-binding protein [Lentisphaeria bacterium]|nr:ATP-binding protein [Lentisphaeria bacterium]